MKSSNMDNSQLLSRVSAYLGTNLLSSEEAYGILNVETTKDKIYSFIEFLKNDTELEFMFLTDICGVHYPDQKGRELAVIYFLHNFYTNTRIRVKVFLDENDANIQTIIPIFSSANWMERETFDFFGINFIGHPKMVRILNVEHMTYHPLRKEFPLEDGTRHDKQDRFFGR